MLKRIFWIGFSTLLSYARFALNGGRVLPFTLFEIDHLSKILPGKRVKLGAGARVRIGNGGIILLGDDVWIKGDVELVTQRRIDIGSDTTIQDRVKIIGEVKIGKSCIIAPNVFISSGTHTFKFAPTRLIRDQERFVVEESREVRIDEDVWLGVNVVIMPGVHIGRGVIVGANSVVTKNLSPYSIHAGAPAKQISQRFDFSKMFCVEGNSVKSIPFFYEGFQFNERESTLEGEFVLIDKKFKIMVPNLTVKKAMFYIFSPNEKAVLSFQNIDYVLRQGDSYLEVELLKDQMQRLCDVFFIAGYSSDLRVGIKRIVYA